MLLVAKVKSSGSTIPEGTVLQIEVDRLPQAAGGGRLDVDDMTVRYPVCRRTVMRWVESKAVPYVKIGGNYYFIEADLDALEASVKSHARGAVPGAIRQRAMERMVA